MDKFHSDWFDQDSVMSVVLWTQSDLLKDKKTIQKVDL